MQRSTSLPPKGKLQPKMPENKKAHIESDASEGGGNKFHIATYHKQTWLLGFFGEKDGSADTRYLGLKSEISAFASEFYRLCDAHSPKYRATYHTKNTDSPAKYESSSFLTKKIESIIVLSDIFTFLEELNDGSCRFGYLYISTYSNAARYFSEAKKEIENWRKSTVRGIDAQFSKVINLPGCMSLKEKILLFLVDLENKLLQGIVTAELNLETEFDDKRNSKKLNTIFMKACKRFHRKNIPVFIECFIAKLEQALLENGLPEIMAVSYVLGEWSFKARDIVLHIDTMQVHKLDHERCLWEISHKLLTGIQTREHFDDQNIIVRQQSFSSHDIDRFPQRTNCPRLWPTSKDEIDSNPKWFTTLINTEAFRKRAYKTFQVAAMIPDKVIASLSLLFFKKSYSVQVADHVVKRKYYLKKAMKHSAKFVDFLSSAEDAQIKNVFAAHNARWHKPKYHDLHIDLLSFVDDLKKFREYMTRKKDDIDHAVNLTYTIKPPKLKL